MLMVTGNFLSWMNLEHDTIHVQQLLADKTNCANKNVLADKEEK